MLVILRHAFLLTIATATWTTCWSAEPAHAAIATLPAGTPVSAITITAEAGNQQTFAGFGTSLGNWGKGYQKLSSANREHLSQALWGDLNFKILRLWVNTFEYAPTAGEHRLTEFRERYIDSGVLADARRHGVTTLLLAPEGMPVYLSRETERGRALRDDAAATAYADLVVDFIVRLRDETGVVLSATGIQNEPNDKEFFSQEQLGVIILRMRKGLDAATLTSVKIIGPETSSADQVLYDSLTYFQRDPATWAALSGVASHTYNMGATEQAQKLAQGKDYWMSETSDNGPEVPGDAKRAATLASRFLSDVNHGVTHWIHFLGFENDDPHDNATRIFSLNLDGLGWTTFLKFQYYRQLSAAFPPGVVFRHCTSSLDGDMTWTYGKKPRLNATCARHPDGGWSIGLSNYTSTAFREEGNTGTWDIDQEGRPAISPMVTVQIREMSGLPDQLMNISRCGPGGTEPVTTSVMMHNGAVAVVVAPFEVVTLRSSP